MLKRILAAAAAAALTATSAGAQDTVKIGFVTTLTTPAAVIGEDMVNSVNLAVEHLGGEMAGKKIEVIFEDDGFKPEIGKQKTDKLVKQDDVDFVTGDIWSNVLLASRKSALDAGKFLISANAGPHELAGELCHENFFSTSWQNDQTPMALGEALNQRGVKSVYVMAPNYAAGKDMAAGVERTFKGEIKGRDFTKWPDQLDFSVELAKARSSGAEALFVFYPGKAGVALVQQYQQLGLQEAMPLYSVFTIDGITLPRLQEANLEGVLGSLITQHWGADLDVPQNKKYVSDYKAKHGKYPSYYGQQSYDLIMLINSAVEAVNGDLSNTDGIRAALEKADFPSTRGAFKMGPNHLPIQNFYLHEIVADEDGVWTTKIVQTVFENHQDSYAKDCKMD